VCNERKDNSNVHLGEFGRACTLGALTPGCKRIKNLVSVNGARD